MLHNARIKLTAWYLLIITTVSGVFSLIIYNVQTNELDRFERVRRMRIERRLEQNNPVLLWERMKDAHSIMMGDPELLSETKRRILVFLISVNGVILVISGGLGYFLAGRTLRPIKDMVDAQNRFISDASHELKTPLTSIKSACEVYLRTENHKRSETHNLIRESINEVDKLQSLTDGLLQLTQYQEDTNRIPCEKVSLAHSLASAIDKTESYARSQKITVQNNAEDATVEGNALSLTNLFVMLIENAIKYNREKGNITIATKRTDGQINISIKDSGIGIDEKDMPYIFDRFYRADRARTKKGSGGYGLGLAIAKKIVGTHHGTLQVTSKPGKGSTFTVRLPLIQSSHG